MVQKYLAIDFGASSGRGILAKFTGDKISLKEVHRFKNGAVFAFGNHYWNILGLFSEIKDCLSKLYRLDEKNIACMGVDTWGVDFALLDSYDKPIQNPLFYRDTYTDGEMERVFNIVSENDIFRRTGIQPMKFNTIFQLSAIKRLFPSYIEKAKTMLLMPDLFNFMLSGIKSTEPSIASTTQLMDVAARKWDYQLIDMLGLPKEIFTDISNAGTILGKTNPEIKEETGMNIPIARVCGHDTGSAVLAVPMEKNEKCVYISCGTWSLLGVELDNPKTDDNALNAGYTNEAGYGNTIRFLKNIMGLWIYQEVKREIEALSGAVSYTELDNAIMSAKPFERFIDPDSPDFFEKGDMSLKISNYCKKTGQTIPNGTGEILRCVTESLAFKYRLSAEKLQDILGYKFDVIRVVGGGCQNEILMQLTANAMGRPVIAGPVEATAIGNAAAQMLATGELSNNWQAREIIARSFDVQEFLPQNIEETNEKYQKFLNIIGG